MDRDGRHGDGARLLAVRLAQHAEQIGGGFAQVAGLRQTPAPGRLALHYAPDAPVHLNAERAGAGEILLGFGPVGPGRWSLSEAGDLREAAANLFRMLREADREKPGAIVVAPIPAQGLGEAVNDRLKRAAGFVG